MITQQLPNTSPMSIISAGSAKVSAASIPKPVVQLVSDVDLCNVACDQGQYIEYVFAEVGGTSFDFKNDFSSFLFRKSISTDTIEIKLFKNDVELAVISDNTYGLFFPTFTEQPLYVGFTLDFRKVIELEGPAQYQVITTATIIGNVQVIESQLFTLIAFDTIAANGTVRLDTIQNGNILRGLDYTGLNWPQSFRVEGFFGNKQREFITDNYTTQAGRTKRQIIDKIVLSYELRIDFIPSLISKQIADEQLLANIITINDYNTPNAEIYRSLEVYPDEIETTNFENNVNSKYLIKFTDKHDDLLKQNF